VLRELGIPYPEAIYEIVDRNQRREDVSNNEAGLLFRFL
jgi:hypothetical protein